MWIYRESQTSTSNITKEEPKEEWIPSNIPEILEQTYISIDEPSTSLNIANNINDNTSIHPILTHDTLVKIIDSVVNIVKDQPLKKIVNSTLIEMVQSDIIKNNIHSATEIWYATSEYLRNINLYLLTQTFLDRRLN